MAQSTQSTSRSIYLDTQSAQQDIKKLQAEADKLKQKLDSGELSGDKLNKTLSKFDEVNAKIKNVQDQLDKGLAPSLVQQQSFVSKLNNELKRMSQSDPAFEEKLKQYKAQSAVLSDMKAKVSGLADAEIELAKKSEALKNIDPKLGPTIEQQKHLVEELGIAITKLPLDTEEFIKKLQELKKEESTLDQMKKAVAGIGAAEAEAASKLAALKNIDPKLGPTLEQQKHLVQTLSAELAKLPVETEEFKNKLVELKKEEVVLDKITNSVKGLDKEIVIDLRFGPSLQQQEKIVEQLKNELRQLPNGAEAFKEKLLELRKAEGTLDEIKQKIKGVDDASKTVVSQGGGLTKIGVFFASFVAGLALQFVNKIQQGIAAVFELRVQLEKSVANLSAITGATGKDLEFLKNSAIEMSKTSSQSAVDFVEGFKLIASAKPELLTAREDLVAVTKAALLLSQASGLELPDASKRLTDALNQFGEPAQAAAKYVDALAAASKYGAAEVPDITEALLQFGAVAKTSNISIYESSGAIELLAEKGLKGAEAGTKLRNVFLRMIAPDALGKEAVDALKKAGVNMQILSDKSLTLEQRLTEFSKIQNNANALTKVFGEVNVVAGQILLQNVPRYAELTSQIKEQGVASEQAATNTDTLSNKWGEFKNLLSSIFLEGSNSPLKKGVEVLTLAVKGLQVGITAVVDGLSRAYSAAKLAGGVLKDLATFSPVKAFNRIKDDINATDQQKQAKEDEKQRAEAKIAADATVRDAAKGSLLEQRKLLQQNVELQNASFKAYEEMVKSGKKNTAEGRSLTLQLFRDAQTVTGLRKLISDGEKSAAKAPPDDNLTKGNKDDEEEAKREKLFEKEVNARKKLFEQYNEFIRGLNQSITDLLTPEASKAFATIFKTTADEMEKLKKLAANDDQYQKGKLIILEKQRVEIHSLVEEESKLYKPAPEQVSTLDPDTLPKALRNTLPKAQVKAPIEIVPEIAPEDEKAFGTLIGGVLDKLFKNRKAGLELDVLNARGRKQERDAKLAQLKDDYDDEMANKNLTENQKLVITAKYNKAVRDLNKEMLDGVLGDISGALDVASQVTGVFEKFAQAQTNKENAQLKNELKNNDTKKASLKKLFDSKVLTQQQYNQKVAELDKDADAKQQALAKAQFERNKKFQLANAAISGAQAVLKSIEVFGVPFPPNFLGIGAMVLTLATVAAEVAAITSQKFATGGQVKPEELKNGKITTAQNIPTQSNGDNVLATVKVGEVILNEEHQRRAGGPAFFRSIGVPGFASGGVVPGKSKVESLKFKVESKERISELVREYNVPGFMVGGMVKPSQVQNHTLHVVNVVNHNNTIDNSQQTTEETTDNRRQTTEETTDHRHQTTDNSSIRNNTNTVDQSISVQNDRLEILNSKLETQNSKLETQNLHLKTQNLSSTFIHNLRKYDVARIYNLPGFASGGPVRPEMLKDGKITVAQNIPTQPNGDSVLATVKPGEVILNEEQQRKLGGPAALKAAGVPGFATGGVVMKPFWKTRPYKSLDYQQISESMQVVKFATGGVVGKTTDDRQQTTVATTDPALVEMLRQQQEINLSLMNSVENLNSQLDKGLDVNFSLSKFDKARDQENRIKKASQFK